MEDHATEPPRSDWGRSSAASSIASAHEEQHQQQHQQPMSRRPSSAASTASTVSSVVGNGHMSEEEQEGRRRQIQSIMCDSALSQKEKSRNIQALMDGRLAQQQPNRRGSSGSYCSSASSAYVSSMADAAAIAAGYYSDEADENGNSVTGDEGYNFHLYHHQNRDELSVASSVTSHELDDNGEGYQKQRPAPATAVGCYRQYHGRSYSLQDWKDMDRVTAAANTTVLAHNPVQVSRLMEQSRPACEHYERRCTIISPCCGLAFGCRICHDECPVLPPPLASRRLSAAAAATNHKNKLERRRSMPVDLEEEEDKHHLIDRFRIKEVICRDCHTRQSSKSNNCLNCGVQFGVYHCNICNLWMSDKELPYHCEDCGFCRVGGRDNFKHCDDCGMCIDALLFDDHNCKSGKYMSNCPICQEDLFSSRSASHEMPCGHAIHWHCFKELTSYDTRCPVCKKTAESPEEMAATWSAIAVGIALQPVPPEMARMVNIFCSDCESSDCNLRWHFLGVRCTQCLSFNTTVEQIVMQGCDAAAYLDRLEASHTVPSNISMPADTFTTAQIVVLASDNSDSMEEDDLPSAQGTSSAGSSDLMDRML